MSPTPHTRFLSYGVCLAVILVLALSTEAQTVYTSQASFTAATSGITITTIEFEGMAPNGYLFEATGGLSISGVTFRIDRTQSNGNLFGIGQNYYYAGDSVLSSQESTSTNNNLVVTLPGSTTAVGFEIADFHQASISVVLSDGSSFSISPPAFPGFTFWGVVSTTPISSLRLTVPPTDIINLDNFQFGPPGIPAGIGNQNSGLSSSPTGAGDNLGQQATTSEPVSTASGNYYYTHSDFTIPGRGLPLIFARAYNTLDNYSGPLGANWTHSYNVVLSQPATGVVVIKWGDGHGEMFTLSGSTYVPQADVFNTLVQNGDGTFTLTRKDQTGFNFAPNGSLTSIRDKNGNAITLTYTSGNLTQITDTVGRALKLSYDGSNRITQITDSIGRTVSFEYDASDNLVKATDQAGGATTFAYDANHRVASITQPNGQVLLQNTLDSSGRVVAQTGGRGFSSTLAYDTPGPNETTITDARGNKTIHTYDGLLRIMQITDAAGGTTSFTYDANNDRTGVANQDGKTTNFAYDSLGNVTGISDPLGGSSSFTYDTKNDLLAATNANGHTTNFTYDGNGNLTKIQDALGDQTKFVYDGRGELTSKTDARGDTTNYAYDASGNLTKITDALGHSTNLAYDGIGRLSSIIDPNGHAASASYDVLSRLVKIADPLGDKTQFFYDPVGNLLKVTDADGHSTSYAYDATNDLVSITDALGHVTKYAYDPVNNRTSFTNALGNITSYAYDAVNRLSTITDPLSFTTSYSYDPAGNVTSTTDAKSQTNKFTYDALNRLAGISYADGRSVSYSYDQDGNRTSMGDAHGTMTYGYDALDRLVAVTQPGGKTATYGYDAVGNRKSLGYPDGKIVNYSYDPANRLSAVTDWLGRVTNYAYDPSGNLTRTAYPNGTTATFSYEPANRLTRIVNALKNLRPVVLGYRLDAVGNRTSFSVDGIATRFSYDALNELTGAQLGPIRSAWTYDAAGNRTSETGPGFSPVASTYNSDDRLLNSGETTFAYDADGNQILKQPTHGPATTYEYDAANRLIAATVGTTTSTFDYDGDGNRISQSVATGTYDYWNDVTTALPVVLQESGPDGNISYAYGLGLISESGPKFDYFYHYDGLGSVVTLSNAMGRPAAAYLYDPWGNPLLAIPDSVGTRNKFRFTGEALDPRTGLYYLRARYYDPGVGRLLSRDPLAGIIRQPQTTNRYVYAMSNPVRYSDPSGFLSITSVFQFFVDLVGLEPAADKSYQEHQQLSQDCGYTGSGNLENCTPQLQQNAQAAQNQAVQKVGEFTVSQGKTIYEGIPVVDDLIWI